MALLRMGSFIPGELSEHKKKVKVVEVDQQEESESDKSSDQEITIIQEVPEIEIQKDIESPEDGIDESRLLMSKENWNDIFEELDLDLGTRQLASHSSFLKVDGTVLYLSMPDEKLNIFNGKHRKELQDSISKFSGMDCNLFLESGDNADDSPNKIKEQEKRKGFEDAQKEIEEDPNVQSLVEAFGAKVIESSIEPRK